MLKKVNNLIQFQIEVINNKRTSFESFSACENCPVGEGVAPIFKSSFVPKPESNFYVIVIDSYKSFEKKFKALKSISTYNSHAQYLIFFAKITGSSINVMKKIFELLMSNLIFEVIMLIPQSITLFKLYKLKYNVEYPDECMSILSYTIVDECQNGKM